MKLLRALQERVVFRVGDSKPEKVDIRDRRRDQPRPRRDDQGRSRFREDLYYRLNVVNIWLPPLRERGDDVLIIAKALLSEVRRGARQLRGASGFTPAGARGDPEDATGRATSASSRTASRRRSSSATRPCSASEDLELDPEARAPILPLEKAKEEFQRNYVLEVLERNNGNRTQTARDLGVDPRTIFRYLEKEQNPMPRKRRRRLRVDGSSPIFETEIAFCGSRSPRAST